jgi:dienelactone hydrolase
MAHGYAGVREHGIAKFAEAFADAGFVVLLHDHRTFGVSGGEPRQDVDPWRQIADWRRAISYLESRPEVDSSRIGLWGTSYAGGASSIPARPNGTSCPSMSANHTNRSSAELLSRKVPCCGEAARERRLEPRLFLQIVDQRLRRSEIRRLKALGEPSIDRRQ